MEKYFIIRVAYGITSVDRKNFEDEAKAMLYADLLADGEDSEKVTYYVTKAIAQM